MIKNALTSLNLKDLWLSLKGILKTILLLNKESTDKKSAYANVQRTISHFTTVLKFLVIAKVTGSVNLCVD